MIEAYPTRTRTWPVLAVLCATQLMLILDISVVNIALPSMQRDLGFTAASLQWVVSGYALTFGGFLLLGGRAADVFGRRRLFVLGLIVFTLASLLGGLAESQAMLIGGRLLQGLGAAMVSPAALSLLTTTFAEGAARNRALGAWGAVSAGGGAVGILIGGPLTEISWRWVLFINVPIGLVVVALALRVLTESRGRAGQRLDLPGALLITTGLISLVYALSEATGGFGRTAVLVPLIAAVVLVAGFVVAQAHAANPLVPLRTFAMRNLTAGNGIILLMLAVVTGVTFFMTLYLQQILHYSPLQTGLAFLPQTLLTILAANVAARLVTRIGFRGLLMAGMAALALGCLLLVRIDTMASYPGVVLPGMLVTALGLGAGFVAGSIAVTAGVAEHDQGLAAGLFNTAQQIGAAVGLAVLVTIAGAHTANPADPETVVTGFRWALAAAAVLALAALMIAAAGIRTRRPAESGTRLVPTNPPTAASSAAPIPPASDADRTSDQELDDPTRSK